MTTITSARSSKRDKSHAFLGHIQHHAFRFRTIAIYSAPADVANAITLLNEEGFLPYQISLLGREQDGWQEKLKLDWQIMHTAKGAAAGAALGLLPGLALVTGVAITGGIGLLAAGPLIGALEALGLGALGGGLMGGAISNLDSSQRPTHIREEIEDAIGRGKWVVVVHCHNETEAMHAQSLLFESRIAREPD